MADLNKIKAEISVIRDAWEAYKTKPSTKAAKDAVDLAMQTHKNLKKILDYSSKDLDYDEGHLIHKAKNSAQYLAYGLSIFVDGIGNEEDYELIDNHFGFIDSMFERMGEEFNPVENDLHELIKGVVADKNDNIKITLNLDELPQKAQFDRKMITDAVEELVDNAMKNLKESKTKNPEITIGCWEKGGYVSVQIQDNGTGLPEEIKDKLFKEKVTGRKEAGGTGVGLGLVKKAIEMHHHVGTDVLKDGHLSIKNAGEHFEGMPGTIAHFRIPKKYTHVKPKGAKP
ncbi:sensor histidine kinase [archaeon]